MKIAISSTGKELSSMVDPRFGRCPYFIILDPDTMEYEAIDNPNVSAMGGAGIQTAQMIANKGVHTVLTGSCGPNAFQTLGAAGVQVIVGVSGQVEEAVQRYKQGQYKPTPGPNVGSHTGMSYQNPIPPDPGFGMGMGFGMGRGMGWGRGMGRFGPGMGSFPFTPPQINSQQELQFLKQQADYLRQQLEMIISRIKELESRGEE
ncbi:hypothetical protein BXT86_00010 [candidate division WOR-3 bacterium 4484_100]|uniref:Dinitrogenase iron-molybdenum cofactor biosynthesis domain-containing protein n=1 Tax=candidate division WOR-3 bacterium 4484_100 TaxID=1936077 RepID=A0A1V4QHC3_UNCW3|nr:MAG: hypothetical protein BXT86_00010 [candidate division WOR-3 bacterium 4484_100]